MLPNAFSRSCPVKKSKSQRAQFGLLALLLLALTPHSAHSEVLPDEQFRLQSNVTTQNRIVGDPTVGVSFSDASTAFGGKPVMILANKRHQSTVTYNESNPYAALCASTTDPACKEFPIKTITAKYPYCQGTANAICIKSLWATLPSGKRIEASFIRELRVATPKPYEEDKELGIPRSAGDSLFEFRDETGSVALSHSGGSLFAVKTLLSGTASSALDFEASIAAIRTETNQSNSVLFKGYSPQGNGAGYWVNLSPPSLTDCVVFGLGECGKAYPLPMNVRFGLSIQSSKFPTRWLHGRLIAPQVQISESNKGYLISIEAEPTRIPFLAGSGRISQLTPALQQRYQSIIETDKKDPKGVVGGDDLNPSRGYYVLNALKEWLEYLPDKAQAMPTAWSIRTISTNDISTAQFPTKCLDSEKGLAGLVTTNATAYSSGPPKFVSATGALEYEVAAPHFEKDGVSAFKGSYDLAIKSDVARCIYGFTNAPVQATVSVLNSTEEQKVVTTTFTESQGWINFSARNFEFSAPKIVVVMTQKSAAPAAKPGSSPSMAPAKATSRTITCRNTKGTLKRVTGVKPSCPKGYQLRRE